jgi:hypothetical protein
LRVLDKVIHKDWNDLYLKDMLSMKNGDVREIIGRTTIIGYFEERMRSSEDLAEQTRLTLPWIEGSLNQPLTN